MKTTKLIIAAVLVLLTTATLAQINRGMYATVEYSQEMNRFETWVSEIGDRISHRDIEGTDRPVVSQIFYTDYAQISYEDEASFEQWMATPYEEAILESEPEMEGWMSRAFDIGLSEEELKLENWMCCPFETGITEEELTLESWMSTPFDTGEVLPQEKWMTASKE